MTIILYSLALILSFYLLAKICDEHFVPALEKISKKLKLSSDAAGATLMAIGSSAPELFVSLLSVIRSGGGSDSEIGMGTIVGSALFNILVIIGATALVKTAKIQWQPVVRDIIFYSISIIFLLFSFQDGIITIIEAIGFVIVYILYVIAVINWRKLMPYKEEDEEKKEEESLEKKEEKWYSKITYPLNKILSYLFFNKKRYYLNFLNSIIFIAGLSWILVESAVIIANELHIPTAIIALTVLAAGTSIPDMISSIIVAKKGKGGMAISNAIGSNIFDILFGLGVPWVLVLSFSKKQIEVSTANLWSSIILLFATVIVIFFLLFIRKWKISKNAGWLLILLYISYLVWAGFQVL